MNKKMRTKSNGGGVPVYCCMNCPSCDHHINHVGNFGSVHKIAIPPAHLVIFTSFRGRAFLQCRVSV